MQDVGRYHRILEFPSASGKSEQWLAIDCAFVESGIKYALENNCKRLLFGSLSGGKKSFSISIDVLDRLGKLEGLIWHIPLAKGVKTSALDAQTHLKYLSIVQPNISIDLARFPYLEYLGAQFSENITGYDRASGSLRYLSLTNLSTDLAFLGSLKGLTKLDLIRADVDTLSGVQELTPLTDLTLTHCRRLVDISHLARLKNLLTLTIEGSSGLTDLAALQELDSLKTLWIKCKEVKSCRFVAAMKSLEFVSINARIVDNDLSPLIESRSLLEVWFNPTRSTYTPRLSPDDINGLLLDRQKHRK